MEDPKQVARLTEASLTLSELSGLILIDEMQLRPDLFPILRVRIDNASLDQRYLILGSASRDLLRQSSESLAGRIAYIELTPFALHESVTLKRYWLRGGFPHSYLADNDISSAVWRDNYIRTYLERNIPQLGLQIPAQQLRRFWMMLTHYHGQTFNASDIGKTMGVAHNTVRRYLDILTGTFMIRELTPWFENIRKRQVRSPKIYFRDSGILHSLAENVRAMGLSQYITAA